MASASSSPPPSEADDARAAPAPAAPTLPPAWRAGAEGPKHGPRSARLLLAMVLVIATAGLVYELAMAAVASYVLGDSVTQFSLVIGVYLSALGLGAYLSRFFERDLGLRFVDVELATALVGGLSAPGLFLAYAHTGSFRLVLYATVVAVGVLVGLELPLLMRILRREYAFKDLVAKALTYDYAGALIGSVAFSLLLVPRLGLVESSLICGVLNALVGLASTWVLVEDSPRSRRQMAGARVRAVLITALLGAALLSGERLTRLAELGLYGDTVISATQSRYQRIVLAKRGDGFQMFLNGNLQFSSADEHRYHEALVHPAMGAAAHRRAVLIGGGGDGLALREVLKWPDVDHVTLVDLDPAMTDLARTHPALSALNARSLEHPKVTVENQDAMIWLADHDQRFDVIVLDFPDPSNFSLGKLYTQELYTRVKARLAPGGAVVVQSTSPLFARQSFWCIERTLSAAGLSTLPYRVFVPSFGEWGFVLAKHEAVTPPSTLPPVLLRYLTPDTVRALFHFPADMQRVSVRVNRLDNQALVHYYTEEWARWQ